MRRCGSVDHDARLREHRFPRPDFSWILRMSVVWKATLRLFENTPAIQMQTLCSCSICGVFCTRCANEHSTHDMHIPGLSPDRPLAGRGTRSHLQRLLCTQRKLHRVHSVMERERERVALIADLVTSVLVEQVAYAHVVQVD
eukprot:366340-Chlamydomonas_euryale.AAC.9